MIKEFKTEELKKMKSQRRFKALSITVWSIIFNAVTSFGISGLTPYIYCLMKLSYRKIMTDIGNRAPAFAS